MAERQPTTPLFTQVDISAGAVSSANSGGVQEMLREQTRLMRELVNGQDRQNELLEELVSQVGAAVSQFGAPMRQRAQELSQWKDSNPALARSCRSAAEALAHVQTEFLSRLAEEATDNSEAMADGEFMLTEFVDRFGPRLAHLNGVLQVLAQLGAATPSNSSS